MIPCTIRLLAFSMIAFSTHSCLSQEENNEHRWNYEKTTNPREIEVKDGQRHALTCRIGIEVDRTILSFDKATLIISENAYLKTIDLQKCDRVNPNVHFTPEDDGMLVDFNLKNDIYISLIFVATQPMSYVAYVGKIGKKKNFAYFPGSYNSRKTMRKMQQEAFNYSDEFLSRPKISLNGRYIDPTGDTDCSAQSHPGVWDIVKNQKVVISQTAKSTTECEALFSK